jgi:Holliday junction resolvase
MNSRAKGARGEREAAAAWATVMGCRARRGQQFSGGSESPDVVSDFGNIHLEVKRVERGNPYWWVEQAERDCGGKIPLVLHRKDRKDWLVILRLADVPRLAKEIAAQTEAVGGGSFPGGVPDPGVPPSAPPDAKQPGVL